MEALKKEVTVGEIIELAAVDSELYGKTFFPDTCRQPAPPFHADMDRVLEDPANRQVAFEVFRGGAKTSKLRLFTSKRVAYGISKTVLVIGKSQEHAVASVKWLMRQVEYNHRWASTFGLKKGKKWTESHLEIVHDTDDYIVTVKALGIGGSIRGVLEGDWRPDLILLDDPCDEENTATPESRGKVADILGSLLKSLSPRSESPDATIALAQTVLVQGDLIDSCMKDEQWAAVRYSCFDTRGESAWPDRWTTDELEKDKQAHVNRNQLSLWLREMECELVTRENAAFLIEWLDYWEVLPQGGVTYIGIDPTPPPKDGNALKQVNQRLDDAVIMVIKFYQGRVFVCDYYAAKSPDPEEFVNAFFTLAARWKPMKVGVETVMHQRTLKWLIDREMLKRRQFYTVIPVEDKRKKETRIIQTITRYASNGGLSVHRNHVEFIEQYGVFQAQATRQHDDYLDALTIAMDLINPALEGVTLDGDYEDLTDDRNYPELEDWRSAP